MKNEREGPRANKAYPISAATVMALAASLPANQQEENYFGGSIFQSSKRKNVTNS